MLAQMLTAVGMVFEPKVLLTILGASIFGLFVGAIPGLTATMATALLVPLTFFMDPLSAVSAIVACTAMAITAGIFRAASSASPARPPPPPTPTKPTR